MKRIQPNTHLYHHDFGIEKNLDPFYNGGSIIRKPLDLEIVFSRRASSLYQFNIPTFAHICMYEWKKHSQPAWLAGWPEQRATKEQETKKHPLDLPHDFVFEASHQPRAQFIQLQFQG